MNMNSKNGELKEYNLVHELLTSRELKLTVNSENNNLLGFRGDTMVFETQGLQEDKTGEVLGTNRSVDISQDLESNVKKFLVLNGKKFQIIKPKVKKVTNKPSILRSAKLSSGNLQTGMSSKRRMEIRPNRKILPKVAVNINKCTSVIVNSVHAKQNLSQNMNSTTASVITVNPDLCLAGNVKSGVTKVDGNVRGSTSKAVTDCQRNIIYNSSTNVQTQSTIKLVNSANMTSKVVPLKTDFSLNRMNKSNDSQVNVMASLLVVPDQLGSNGFVKSCNCNVNKIVVSTSTNTEGHSVISREVQTEEPFDYLLDSLLSQCLHAEKSESVITGRNVDMGIGSHTSVENNAKTRFFMDLHNCLLWDSGNLPIHKGVIQKDLGLVKRQCVMLKARNAGVNIINSSNITPLQLAVIHNVNADIVQVLLSYKADMSILDPEGNNVLHLAVENNRKDLVKLFLDNMNDSTINIDQFNYNGLTPLMLCAFDVDRIDMAENLLKMGAQTNLRDLKSGRTVLFHGAENHNTPIVSLLLDYGADTKIRNFFGTSIHDAVFELEDIPNEIKYPILGRDLKLHQRRKLSQPDGVKNADQIKRKKLQIVPTYQKIMSNTKFVVNMGNNKN